MRTHVSVHCTRVQLCFGVKEAVFLWGVRGKVYLINPTEKDIAMFQKGVNEMSFAFKKKPPSSLSQPVQVIWERQGR